MVLDWSKENPLNGFDPEVLNFPTTITLCAYDKEGPAAFLPFQQPYMVESFAPRPGLSKLQAAAAFKEMFQAIVTQAHVRGVGEIYYLGTDEDTNDMTTSRMFEELPYKVYRVKVRELESGS